jgi:ABC-2 type transport system permease protein
MTSPSLFAQFPMMLLVQAHLVQAWRKLLTVGKHSRLLTLVIVLFMAGYLFLSFALFYKALLFVKAFPGLGPVLAERLLYLLFAFLFLLLFFSNLVISYTNLFRNQETAFLLTMPVSRITVFRWKSLESSLLASWAFLFLIAPLLAAYGMTHQVAWHFYPVTLLLILLFIVLPALAGAWMAVLLGRSLDRRRFQIALLSLGTLLVVGTFFWMRPEAVTDEMLETRVLEVLDRLLVKTRFAQFAFLPSYWLSSGVLHWSEGAIRTALFFGLVLFSHALFFGYLSLTRMGDLFYDAASSVQSRGGLLRKWGWNRFWDGRRTRFAYRPGMVERFFGLFPWIKPDARAILVKDVRIFWRDTTQWGQTLVLFGLLGIYIFNLRHFSHQLTNPFWINLVAYLNLGACSLNLATLTTRFVYPQFSLEGKRLWIVGLAPLGLAQIVKAKFLLTTAASLAVTVSLVGLSCHMLQIPVSRTLYFVGSVAVMSFTLNGLALGLGTLYPNFKEDNPSKIVSGFGGTLCLVLSFLYIVGSVILLAVGSPWGIAGQSHFWIGLAWGGFILLSASLGWGPFLIGLKRLRHFEL